MRVGDASQCLQSAEFTETKLRSVWNGIIPQGPPPPKKKMQERRLRDVTNIKKI